MITELILSTQMRIVLFKDPPVDRKAWKFIVLPDRLELRRPAGASGKIHGKRIAFTATAVTLGFGGFLNNRILQGVPSLWQSRSVV